MKTTEQIVADADAIESRTRLEAETLGLKLIVIVFDESGKYQVRSCGNQINEVVGLLTRAAVQISMLKADQGAFETK